MSGDPDPNPIDVQRRRSARWHIILIGSVAAFPIIGSLLLYQFWRPSSFVNHGELIAPKQALAIDAQDALAPMLRSLSGKWVLLTLDSGSCDQACQKKLYYIRQLRLTQGKEMDRIERLWVLTDAVPPDPALLTEHAGLKFISAPTSQWVAKLPPGDPPASYIYVLDPLGNLVLRYPRGFDPTGMKKDLLRLLRASRVG